MSARDDRPARAAEGEQDENFLSRWSRRKQASREGRDVAQPPLPADAPVEAGRGREASDTRAEQQRPDAASDPGEALSGDEAEAPELPPIDSLTGESDYGPFMRPGVDPALRRLALRKMWQNPKYAVVDDLDPFRADFAAFTPLGDIVTSDMKFHAERLLREQLEKVAEATGASAARPEEGTPAPADEVAADEVAADDALAARQGDSDQDAARDDAADEPDTDVEDGDDRRIG